MKNEHVMRCWEFLPAGVATACLISFTACDAGRRNETSHPLPDRIPGSEGAITIEHDPAPHGIDGATLERWLGARETLLNTRLFATIGSQTTEAPDLLGLVADVVVDRARDLFFVLDEQAQEVRIFTLRGDFVDAFGGIGDGPSDLRLANSIELISGGRVLVGTLNLQAKVFAATPNGWQAEHIVPLPSGARGLCAGARNRVFVNAHDRKTNQLVHEINLNAGTDTTLLSGFAGGYEHDNWLVQRYLGTGSLACLAMPRPLVVFGQASIPILRAFDPDSRELVWASQLTHFTPVQLYSGTDAKGDYIYQDRPEEWDFVGAVHSILDMYLLVQVGHGDSTRQELTVKSYLLDARTGHGAFIGDELPWLIPYENGYVGIFEDPYPRLELRVFREAT